MISHCSPRTDSRPTAVATRGKAAVELSPTSPASTAETLTDAGGLAPVRVRTCPATVTTVGARTTVPFSSRTASSWTVPLPTSATVTMRSRRSSDQPW